MLRTGRGRGGAEDIFFFFALGAVLGQESLRDLVAEMRALPRAAKFCAIPVALFGLTGQRNSSFGESSTGSLRATFAFH
jgi:hypothetical protein